jgi:hypothetical protein
VVRPPPSSVCRAPRAALEGRTVPLGAVLCGSGWPLSATEGGGRGTTTRPTSVCKRCNHGAWGGKSPSYPRKNQIIPPGWDLQYAQTLQSILLGSLALPSTPVVPPFLLFCCFPKSGSVLLYRSNCSGTRRRHRHRSGSSTSQLKGGWILGARDDYRRPDLRDISHERGGEAAHPSSSFDFRKRYGTGW